jgi:hypothetical protein
MTPERRASTLNLRAQKTSRDSRRETRPANARSDLRMDAQIQVQPTKCRAPIAARNERRNDSRPITSFLQVPPGLPPAWRHRSPSSRPRRSCCNRNRNRRRSPNRNRRRSPNRNRRRSPNRNRRRSRCRNHCCNHCHSRCRMTSLLLRSTMSGIRRCYHSCCGRPSFRGYHGCDDRPSFRGYHGRDDHPSCRGYRANHGYPMPSLPIASKSTWRTLRPHPALVERHFASSQQPPKHGQKWNGQPCSETCDSTNQAKATILLLVCRSQMQFTFRPSPRRCRTPHGSEPISCRRKYPKARDH